MSVLKITDKDFEKIIKEEKKVLIDCYADWCGPCKMLSPVIDEVSEEVKDYKFYKLNVDDNEETAKKYGIMSIPTLLLFENGELKDTLIGFKPKDDLIEILK